MRGRAGAADPAVAAVACDGAAEAPAGSLEEQRRGLAAAPASGGPSSSSAPTPARGARRRLRAACARSDASRRASRRGRRRRTGRSAAPSRARLRSARGRGRGTAAAGRASPQGRGSRCRSSRGARRCARRGTPAATAPRPARSTRPGCRSTCCRATPRRAGGASAPARASRAIRPASLAARTPGASRRARQPPAARSRTGSPSRRGTQEILDGDRARNRHDVVDRALRRAHDLRRGQLGQPPRDRVIQRDEAVVHEEHDRCSRDRLRDRGDPDDRVRLDIARGRGLDVLTARDERGGARHRAALRRSLRAAPGGTSSHYNPSSASRDAAMSF